jgi:hypothetical protein
MGHDRPRFFTMLTRRAGLRCLLAAATWPRLATATPFSIGLGKPGRTAAASSTAWPETSARRRGSGSGPAGSPALSICRLSPSNRAGSGTETRVRSVPSPAASSRLAASAAVTAGGPAALESVAAGGHRRRRAYALRLRQRRLGQRRRNDGAAAVEGEPRLCGIADSRPELPRCTRSEGRCRRSASPCGPCF